MKEEKVEKEKKILKLIEHKRIGKRMRDIHKKILDLSILINQKFGRGIISSSSVTALTSFDNFRYELDKILVRDYPNWRRKEIYFTQIKKAEKNLAILQKQLKIYRERKRKEERT